MDDTDTLHDPLQLKSVLVTYGYWSIIKGTDVRQYLEKKTESGGEPVGCVFKLGDQTHIADFHEHDDALKVVRSDVHSIMEYPVCVFLYDKRNRSVYSGHQTLSCEDQGRKHAVDIQRVKGTKASTTVLIAGVPYLFITADGIKTTLQNLKCRVKSVQCLETVDIAIVDFENSEDAMRMVSMERVSVPIRGGECTVFVFLLRLLPSDPADIYNAAHTSIAGMPASTVRVGQTQSLESNEASRASVTPPHGIRTQTHPESLDTAPVARDIVWSDAPSASPVGDDIPQANKPLSQAHVQAEETLEACAITPDTTPPTESHIQTEERTEARDSSYTPSAMALCTRPSTQIRQNASIPVLPEDPGAGCQKLMEALPRHIQSLLQTEMRRMEGQLEGRLQIKVERIGRKSHNELHRLQGQIKELGRQNDQLQARLQDETKRRYKQFQKEMSSLKDQLKADMERCLERCLHDERKHMEQQFQREMCRQKDQLEADMLARSVLDERKSIEIEFQTELRQLMPQADAQVETKAQMVTSNMENQLKTELRRQQDQLSQLQAQIEAQVEAQVETNLQARLKSVTPRVENQTQTQQPEVSQSQNPQFNQLAQMSSDVTRLQNQLQSVVSQLQSQQETNVNAHAECQTCLQMQDRMHSRILNETQAQLRAEIVTLAGEMRNLKAQFSRLQTQVTCTANHCQHQLSPDRQEAESTLTVENSSLESESVSGLSSSTVPWTVVGNGILDISSICLQ